MIRVTCGVCGLPYQMPATFHALPCPHCEIDADDERRERADNPLVKPEGWQP